MYERALYLHGWRCTICLCWRVYIGINFIFLSGVGHRQMRLITDTNRILDVCTCGARGGFVRRLFGVSAECSECAQATRLMRGESEAMVAWNKMIRKQKGIIK